MSTQLLTLLALLLMGIGVFGLLSRRHIMKIIVSFSLSGYGNPYPARGSGIPLTGDGPDF